MKKQVRVKKCLIISLLRAQIESSLLLRLCGHRGEDAVDLANEITGMIIVHTKKATIEAWIPITPTRLMATQSAW